ncbi:MAG: NOL1/NOP2/sun family putative RNA methylase [Nitrososphaeraceae archaeon]|jgi:tRNA (cytosine40_48-C5)-methyltransferase
MKTVIFPRTPESVKLAKTYGYDEWLISRFIEYVPDLDRFLETMNGLPNQYIRTNTIKISNIDLEKRLTSKGFHLKDTVIRDVFAVEKSPFPIGATTEYLLGYYYIQDLSSCIAVESLDVQEDQIILDMASAPGGKTTFIAQKMKNTGCVIALDINSARINSMVFNIARCGVMNSCIYKMDSRQVADLNIKFDRVLLDAPCSCEGVIIKDKTRKTSHTAQDVEYCVSNQMELIEAAIKVVRPGGLLVYSTCSFAPEENENIVNSTLDRFDVKIEPVQYGIEGLTNFGDIRFHDDMKNTKRLYPHIHNTLGFYIARLRINN